MRLLISPPPGHSAAAEASPRPQPRPWGAAFGKGRALVPALSFWALCAITGTLAVLCALYTPCYALRVEGVSLGPVKDAAVVSQAVAQAEGQIERALGKTDYDLQVTLDVAPILAPKEALLAPASLGDALLEAAPEVKEAYVLTVDGDPVGAASDQAEVEAALTKVKTRYIDADTQEVYFANDTRITRKLIPAEAPFVSGEELAQTVTQGREEGSLYTVRPGDTLETIAAAHLTAPEALLALNPGLTPEAGLVQGQLLTIVAPAPALTVCTVNQEESLRPVESPLREVADPERYRDQRTVLTWGLEGRAKVLARVTYLNGQLRQEEILRYEVIQAPTETVVLVGTKERPAYYGSGTFSWPCQGSITSPFGYRYIFGGTSFHRGIDIANASGTPIYAADSGIVEFVGYKGSYGNLVILDHQNGLRSYYAHCENLLVAEGQGVEQGELVALMGSTGRSTGNHCHFEIQLDGEPVDPADYLN